MSDFRKLTRKGNPKVPRTELRSDGKKRQWVNVRGRYKHEMAILERLEQHPDRWFSSKELFEYVLRLWPKSAGTCMRITNYCMAMAREGRIERSYFSKKTRWKHKPQEGVEE